MNKANVMQGLGLCKKANKLVSGEELVLSKIKTKKASLVFLASAAGVNTTKRITDKSLFYGIMVVNEFNTLELNTAIGTENRKVLAITNKSFSKMIMEQLEK